MAVTIGGLLSDGIARLKNAGVSEPELSARLLLQHLLKLNQLELSLNSANAVDQKVIDEFDQLLKKRCRNVPVQYLIGEVEFYNIKLKVDPRVLIPRPETEELVEHLLTKLKGRRGLTVLDIGAGSGNIAIALAANMDDCHVSTVDISEQALELAATNAKLNHVESRIKFICDDCCQTRFWDAIGRFDVIVSNPPYIGSNEYAGLQPEVRDHEPRAALIAESDPLLFYKAISRHAASSLNQHGVICFEVGIGQADEISNLIKSNLSSAVVSIIKDITNIPRIVIGELQ